MIANRRVKIVGTIGPSTSSEEALTKAIQAGLNVARLNFSHGAHEDHLKVLKSIRKISKTLQAPVAILQDLQGPKIRVGRFEGGGIDLPSGSIVTVTTEKKMGKAGLIPSDFEHLSSIVSKGTKILMDDGLIELRVEEVRGVELDCRVIFGGYLKDRKGFNVPGIDLPIDSLTEKDLKDLEFGLDNQVDYVALSFVRSAKDIRKLREIVEARSPSTQIVAKIEMVQALDNLEEIVRLCDGIMVARGDLAIEVGQSQLPRVQKEIIQLCNQLAKPVITATQMLDSMVENARPTRAEITDVANAVLDGSDALMLSAETASGKNPFRCIRTMHEIISEVERNSTHYYRINMETEYLSPSGAIAASACLCALKLNAKAIICLTSSGQTATIVSKFRPKAKIIAATNHVTTLNRMELVWGIQTLQVKIFEGGSEAMRQIEQTLLECGVVKTGDKVILTLAQPLVEGAQTNSIRVYTIGGGAVNILPVEQLPLRCQPEDRYTF